MPEPNREPSREQGKRIVKHFLGYRYKNHSDSIVEDYIDEILAICRNEDLDTENGSFDPAEE